MFTYCYTDEKPIIMDNNSFSVTMRTNTFSNKTKTKRFLIIISIYYLFEWDSQYKHSINKTDIE